LRVKIESCKENAGLQQTDGDSMQPRYLRPEEVTERSNNAISVRTLANWRYLGTGPTFCLIGGRILYSIAALDEWESKRTVSKTNEYRR
jgi:hypothetical protein